MFHVAVESRMRAVLLSYVLLLAFFGCTVESSAPLPASALKVADFACLCDVNLVDGQMGGAFNSPDWLQETYVEDSDPSRGGVAKLVYTLSKDGWSAFWLKLQGIDISGYQRVTFYARGDANEPIPGRFKVELKRNDGKEMGICYPAGSADTSWRRFGCELDKLSPVPWAGSLSGWDNMNELVIVFEQRIAGSQGVLYVDNVQFE